MGSPAPSRIQEGAHVHRDVLVDRRKELDDEFPVAGVAGMQEELVGGFQQPSWPDLGGPPGRAAPNRPERSVNGPERQESTRRGRGALVPLVGLLLPAAVSGQLPASAALGVDRFGIEDGLPGTYVQDIAVADDGRLWLRASGHLVSFDGLEFEDHDLARFPDDQRVLRALAAGRGDTLWVVVGRGLFSYVRGEAHRHATLEGLARRAWQGEGPVRVWDDAGALLLRDSILERVLRLEEAPFLGSRAEPGLEASGDLWVHPPEPGGRFRIHTPRILSPDLASDPWPFDDPGNRTLLSRPGPEVTEVTRLDGSPVTRIPRSLGDRPLLLDRAGRIWTSTPGAITAIDAGGRALHTLALASGADVGTVAEDDEGTLWVGTVTHGLYRIRALPVRTLGAADGVTDGQVLRVSAGPSGAVVLVEHGGRVVRISDEGATTVYDAGGADRVHGVVEDSRGTIWMSLVDDAGTRLEGRTPDGRTIRLPGVRGGRLLEDPFEPGVLRVAGSGERIRPYALAGPIVEGPLLEPGWSSRDATFGPDGALWVTGTGGLARLSPDGVDLFGVSDGFALAGGRAVHRTEDGSIWIGHPRNGLVRFRDGEFRPVTADDGLWDDGASTILEDDHGNLWMSSNRGVHRVPVADLNAFLDGTIDRVRGRGYGPDAGFRSPETSGFHGARDSRGRLWFPTFSGVAVIDPDAVLAREQAPPGIRLRGLRTEGGAFAPESGLVLPLGRRRVDVAYAATLLSGHGGVRYEVLLEGVDEGWVDVGGQRQVTYGSVSPGEHVFRVRAVSGAGVSSLEEAALVFTVPPYFHETRTFLILLALAAGGALWALVHLRERRLRRRATVLAGMVDERTRELARAKDRTEAALVTVEAQAAQLRSLDEAKSRFFANVSHELRTPLTLIQGPLQDVLDGRLGPATDPVRAQVETVLASGRRLGELVEQLLDVARLESGELHLDLRRQDLAPLFHRLVQAFDALARSRDITFEARVPDGAVPATVDADQMEKVWANLLANALKFAPGGGRVAFTVEAGDELVVTVEDDGPGIPPDELESIFERFHQVDGSSRRVHGGAGLGLALVKEVTELHGGTVDVQSELGRGSRFVVRVPRAAGADAPEPASPAPHDTDDTRRRTILVVEDNVELRAYLRRHLSDRYRVVEAENGRVGLDVARSQVPDLILCDVMMPEMDGEELCRAVRADPELAFLPVVMLTARASRESRLSALEGGADDYLVKPFDPGELGLRIRNLFAARQRLAERFREQGRSLPFVPLEGPGQGADRDFATAVEAVMRRGMADEDFGVDDMARGMAMSRSTLYRKTEEVLGTSPMELLWGYRLDQAAHWLRETDATVSEVAYGAGFKTVPHFTRRFKERFGETPAAWREDGETPTP